MQANYFAAWRFLIQEQIGFRLAIALTALWLARSIRLMAKTKASDIQVTCPCCGASITIDAQLRQVISHEAPPPQRGLSPDLDRAAALLREQAAKREALFNQSAQDLKTKSQVLERKFEEALGKSKESPITKPTRDIDLD
jgi:hypothetical protein